uniref:Chlororespiratory reduction 42 n=1 Tax=California macrophylla TaxID=337344 RepID=A0A0F7J4B0_9ROSI|nr:chlororespiratory reduction 42 [California macrophylla]
MAFSLHCSTQILVPHSITLRSERRASKTVRCESSSPGSGSSSDSIKLEIGSPVIVVEAPRTIKTASSMPCLLVNSGLVNPGDVGRIVSRKPKDVWAVRLAIGTYLIDAKYFKLLVL